MKWKIFGWMKWGYSLIIKNIGEYKIQNWYYVRVHYLSSINGRSVHYKNLQSSTPTRERKNLSKISTSKPKFQ